MGNSMYNACSKNFEGLVDRNLKNFASEYDSRRRSKSMKLSNNPYVVKKYSKNNGVYEK